MIEQLADMPAGTLGFALSGDVTRDEYKAVLLPPIRDAVERGDRIRMLVQIGPGFGAFEPGALLEDSKMGLSLGIRHHDAWERTAIVTDVDWIARASHMFAWMVPGELQVRPLAEADEARAWLTSCTGSGALQESVTSVVFDRALDERAVAIATDAAMSREVPQRVLNRDKPAPVQALHPDRDGRLGRHDEEVNMVVQQAIRQPPPGVAVDNGAKASHVRAPISVVSKHALPFISAPV